MQEISLVEINKHFENPDHLISIDRLTEWMGFREPESFYRMNPAEIANELEIDKMILLDIFLAGTIEGYFDLRWDYHCPCCNGIPGFSNHLKTMPSDSYCSACSMEFRNTLDNNIEVTFSTSSNFIEIPQSYIEEQTKKMIDLVMKKQYKMSSFYISGLDCFHNNFFHLHFSQDVLSVEESLEIKSVCILFTDIKGSTALYDKLGDVKAYKLVREHFKILFNVIEKNNGIIIKTIGDSVMASFQKPIDSIRASFEMQEKIKSLIIPETENPLEVKFGIHQGNVIVVNLNDKLDYFGQTVNLSSRIQGLGKNNEIFFSEQIFNDLKVKEFLIERVLELKKYTVSLRGITEEKNVFAVE